MDYFTIVKESDKIMQYIQTCSQQFNAANKPVFENGKWRCDKSVHNISTLTSRLSLLIAQAHKQAAYARMVERGEVPEHLRTERTI